MLLFYNVFSLASTSDGFCTIWMLYYLYHKIMYFIIVLGGVFAWYLIKRSDISKLNRKIVLVLLWIVILIHILFSFIRYDVSRPDFECPSIFMHIEND